MDSVGLELPLQSDADRFAHRRQCTLTFLARDRPDTELTLSTICSNNSTLALHSNESPPFGQSPNLGQIGIPNHIYHKWLLLSMLWRF